MEIFRLLELNKHIQSFQAVKQLPELLQAEILRLEEPENIVANSNLLKILLQKLSDNEISILKLGLLNAQSAPEHKTEELKLNLLKNFFSILEQDSLKDSEKSALLETLSKSGITSKLLSGLFEALEPSKRQLLTAMIQTETAKTLDAVQAPTLTELEVIFKQATTEAAFSRLLLAYEQVKNPESRISPDKVLLNIVNKLIHLHNNKLENIPEVPLTNTDNNNSIVSDLKLANLIQETTAKNPKLIQLLNKLESLAVLKPTQNISPEFKTELVSALLKFSIQIKSAEVFSFSKTLIHSRDLTAKSAIELLLPLSFMSDSASMEPEEKLLKLNKFLRINSLQTSPQQPNSVNAKNLERSTESKFNNQSQLADKAAQDLLSKLNQVADDYGEVSYQQLNLPFCPTPIEIKYGHQHLIKVGSEKERNIKSKDEQSEVIECSLKLPKLGIVGIKISIFKQNVSIILSSESSQTCELASQTISDLNDRLMNKGFEKPLININNKPPAEVKPEWLLSLIKLNTVC